MQLHEADSAEVAERNESSRCEKNQLERVHEMGLGEERESRER